MSKASNVITGVLGLAAGALLGFIVGGKVTAKKCYARTDKELEDMKKYYEEEYSKSEPSPTPEPEPKSEPKEKAEEIIHEEHYARPVPPEPSYHVPYIVDVDGPDYYRDNDFDEESYTLYEDGVLANELDQGMSDDDIDRTIGLNNLETFKKDEDADVVVIRNERYQVEYEVIKSPMKYEQVLKEKPWLMNG